MVLLALQRHRLTSATSGPTWYIVQVRRREVCIHHVFVIILVAQLATGMYTRISQLRHRQLTLGAVNTHALISKPLAHKLLHTATQTSAAIQEAAA